MRRSGPTSLICALLLAGCAAAVPGYSPVEKSSPLDRVKPFESGTVDDAGTYVPSQAERNLSCAKLTGSMRIILTRLKDAGNRPQPSAATTILSHAATSFSGRPRHMDMAAELRREHARLIAYNALLADKRCPTLDLAKDLPKS